MGRTTTEKQEIAPISMRLPIKYRILIHKFGIRNKLKDLQILMRILDNEEITTMGADGAKRFDQIFNEQGFCKYDQSGVCMRPMFNPVQMLGNRLTCAQKSVGKNHKNCVEHCKYV